MIYIFVVHHVNISVVLILFVPILFVVPIRVIFSGEKWDIYQYIWYIPYIFRLIYMVYTIYTKMIYMVFTIYIRDIYHISQNFSAPSAPVQNVLIYMVYTIYTKMIYMVYTIYISHVLYFLIWDTIYIKMRYMVYTIYITLKITLAQTRTCDDRMKPGNRPKITKAMERIRHGLLQLGRLPHGMAANST